MSNALAALAALGATNHSRFGTHEYSTTSTIFPSTISSIFLRALLIFILIMIILIFIHFTIHPIFKTTADSPGIIPVPSQGNDKVFWQTKQQVAPLAIANTPIGSSDTGFNYSLTLDIEIDDAHQYNNVPRILFFKGNKLKTLMPSNSLSETVASMIDGASLIVSLTRDTNDLHIAVVTQTNELEGVLIYNIPLRQPFRIGIILSEKRLEVYTNGLLSRTRTLTTPPKPVQGTFWPSALTGIQLRNLHIWPTVITPQEIRAASPALNAASFDPPSFLQDTCAVNTSVVSASVSAPASASASI